MANSKSIEIEFGNDGSVKIEAVGFKGKGCEKATAAFEEALGTVKKRTHKREYTAQVSTTNTKTQRT